MRVDLHTDFPPLKSWVRPEHRNAYRLAWWAVILLGLVVILGTRPAQSYARLGTSPQVVVQAQE
jgi:uncharacterized Rmd1/YagE family protein